MRALHRLDCRALTTGQRIFGPIGLRPVWRGPIRNKRWRITMAWLALRGYELGGFDEVEVTVGG